MTIDLPALIGRDTQLKRVASTHGGELAGPCPLCHLGGARTTGADRFVVWDKLGRWACLGPRAGRNGCDLHGDAIDYLRHRDGIGYREACARLGIVPRQYPRGFQKGSGGTTSPLHVCCSGPLLEASRPDPLTPPPARWQAHAAGIAARCAVRLFRPAGARALTYLHGRGLTDATLQRFNIGYNPQHIAEPHAEWGLPAPADPAQRIHVPRGITIPWYIDGAVWRLNVRRPVTAAQVAGGQPKYLGPAGFANALYHAASLTPATPVVLVEGELDALTVVQACGAHVAAVATGSTAGGRRAEWIARLAAAPCVLIAFDHDINGAGDKAAAWWLTTLPNARRWLPLTHDVNSAPDPQDVRRWVAQGLAYTARNRSCSN